MTNTPLILRGELKAAAGGKARRLRIDAYGGGLMKVDGFGWTVIDLDGLALPATIPILADHKNEIAAVIGNGVPTIRGGKLTIAVDLAENEAAGEVLALLESGVVLGASVGVTPLKSEYLREGETI